MTFYERTRIGIALNMGSERVDRQPHWREYLSDEKNHLSTIW